MNFGLRGDESDGDQEFVEQYCKSRNLLFHSKKVDTKAYMLEQKGSVQMTARDLRYAWFEELKSSRQLNFVATAHHSDDSIETVFMNIIRGTGISGLKGIISNERAIRPLLCFSRTEILSFAQNEAISWREDSSNAKDDYLRNKLRRNILPKFDEINEHWRDNIIQLSKHVLEADQILEEYYQHNLTKFFDSNKIYIDKLLALPHAKWMFQRILAVYHFTNDTSMSIFNKLDVQKGKFFESISHRLIKEDGYFEIVPRNIELSEEMCFVNNSDHEFLVRNLRYEIQMMPMATFNGEFIISNAYLDYNKLSFPLLIRKWQAGDWFIPFGMKGKKKLSDYFVDEKFTIQEKENTFVVVSGEDIVCILGHRTDDRYKIKEDTSIIYHIKQKHG